MTQRSLSSLNWVSQFLEGTPGDEVTGGSPRQVPGACWSRVRPEPMPEPVLRLWSDEVAREIGLEVAEPGLLGGNGLVEGMDPYAQRYGGYQFGNWAGQLGDGRAITLGEVVKGNRVMELQLKGSGKTPYSRFSDGRAVLRSSIREFLCSEAMHHLGVPTTRALSLVTTGEDVIRDVMYDGRPAPEPGAIVCRVAESFIRFGSFEIHSMSGDGRTLRILVDDTVRRHFPGHSSDTDEGLVEWLMEVAARTSQTIAHWMRVGFVHGVMNTDNMSIHGLTIDYGPYGWLEGFEPGWTPNTTDSGTRRYSYGQQAQIGAWNIARLLEAISPLMEDPVRLNGVLDSYYDSYREHSSRMWAEKLGLDEFEEGDGDLVTDLTSNLQLTETDMTIFFRLLSTIDGTDLENLDPAFYDEGEIRSDEWNAWLTRWWDRVDGKPDRGAMLQANPKYVLRNWMAQLAIDAAEKGDYSVAMELYEMLKNPYSEQSEHEEKWFSKRPEWARNRVGCSMLSCSS
ncbi:MAG: YdiU family protein [Candidatus Thalassarchaeaceae archaeon]|nr:YdiU family protein [Candidatus Thalassarchaeaceae archaeon]